MDNDPLDIEQRLLTGSGIKAARASFAPDQWFGHASVLDDFVKIQQEGLRPNKPEASVPPTEVLAALGPEGEKIICLSILPMTKRLLLNKEGKSLFKLAFPEAALPERVGLDWSFGGVWSLDVRRSGLLSHHLVHLECKIPAEHIHATLISRTRSRVH